MAGFGLNLKLVLYLQSQCLTESLGFLNPPHRQAEKRYGQCTCKNTNMDSQLHKFINDISILTLDDEFKAESLKLAIDNLKLEEIEFTGNGCFITFDNEENATKLDVLNDESNQSEFRFNGVELENNEMNLLCDINVYIIDLKIDHIEIWNKLGTEMNEIPSKYILRQMWKSDSNKTLERK